MKQLGCETTFVNGLRVTDSQTRDVAMMVLAGQLNKQLVAAIGAAGQPAIGHLRRRSAHGAAPRRRSSPTSASSARFAAVDAQWIERFWKAGVVPVVSSLALGFDGEYYNVNADQMASAFAVACDADALVYLTDVAGVKDADGTVIRWLEVKAIAAHGAAGHGQRRHVAQAGSLHQRAEEGRDACAHSAGDARRSFARILHPSHRLRYRGDCVMTSLNHLVLIPTERKEGAWPGPRFDRALERRY